MATQTYNPQFVTKRLGRCTLCGQDTDRRQPYCSACQRELAGASSQVEQETAAALAVETGPLPIDQIQVTRLGDRLVEQGLLEPGLLDFALRVQAHRADSGQPVLLGQLLLELDLISRQALDQVAMQQLLHTQQALQRSNQQLEQRVQDSTHQLKSALVKLSELSQLKADFVANLSHELRTPLAIMSGFAEMVNNESLGPLNQDQASAMDSLLGAGRRLEKLVADLLDFSAATQGAIRLQLEPISLHKPVKQAMRKVQALAQRREVMLVHSLPDELPRVQVDRQKLGWVIGEFLENAVKYTPPGGLVKLQAEVQPSAVNVAVIDSGIGIPEERQEEVFFPFHQLDGSMTRQQGGTGLGLALAQRIIEAHGSRIDVRSAAGDGSQFAFALPLAG